VTTDTDGCQPKTRDWILARIFDLWPYSIVLIINLIGLWLISVGLLSRLPRPARPASASVLSDQIVAFRRHRANKRASSSD
jgi:hypothetical protein